MPWHLEIHIIDVGQGESSLIVASSPSTGQKRSILVDGGEKAYAETIHNYIVQKGLSGVDHILVSHYDNDHSGGITSLLIADNLYRICDTVARLVAAHATTGVGRAEQIALGSAAATCALLGAYDVPGGANHSAHIGATAAAVRALGLSRMEPPIDDDDAADRGVIAAENAIAHLLPLNPQFIQATAKRRAIARSAGIDAANALAAPRPDVVNATRRSVFDAAKSCVPSASRFRTGGIYANTHLIDIGQTEHEPREYASAAAGGVLISENYLTRAPGINRPRTEPDPGDEVMWGSGPGAIIAPAKSPSMFVLSCRRSVLGGGEVNSGQRDNDDSIGLILRFNEFFYYTAGDLPSQGDELIAARVMTRPLRNPAGGDFPVPHRIAVFKCGHHGSSNSTSARFLATALPRVAFISCGENQFGHGDNHPTQALVDRLHSDANLAYFYLTNCKYATNYIPTSSGQSQMTTAGHKSRVSGDNADKNLGAGRVSKRGDIRLSISDAESGLVRGPARQFYIHYFEEDLAPPAFRTEIIDF